jgi:hypothetical protein
MEWTARVAKPTDCAAVIKFPDQLGFASDLVTLSIV